MTGTQRSVLISVAAEEVVSRLALAVLEAERRPRFGNDYVAMPPVPEDSERARASVSPEECHPSAESSIEEIFNVF